MRFSGSLNPGPEDNISESLVTNFWVKNTLLLCQLAQMFLYLFKKKLIFNFAKATKKVKQQTFLHCFCVVVGSVVDTWLSGVGCSLLDCLC
jgi:hypothetical protein